LYSAQMNDLQEALLVNPLKFQGKSVQSVRKRVTNICDYLSSPMSVEQFIDYLYTYIIQHIPGTQYVSISKQDQSAIHQLRDKKYVTWEWNYGHSPQFTFHKSAKTAGGIIEVFLDISEGNIQSMHLCGDFFADQDISKLEQYFFNKRYDLASLSEMLQSISISSYIRNVTNEEFLQLLF